MLGSTSLGLRSHVLPPQKHIGDASDMAINVAQTKDMGATEAGFGRR